MIGRLSSGLYPSLAKYGFVNRANFESIVSLVFLLVVVVVVVVVCFLVFFNEISLLPKKNLYLR